MRSTGGAADDRRRTAEGGMQPRKQEPHSDVGKKINSCVIPNSLEDLGRFLYRSPPELCLLCAPDSSATLSAICTGTIRNFMGHLHRDPPNLISHPEPSSISSAIYAGTVQNLISFLPGTVCAGTLRNLICNLRQNSPELHQLSAPKPSGTSSAICTGTLRKLVCYLHRNPPELYQPAAPELSGTSSAICTGTLRNLSNLHRKAPEPSGTFSGTWCCSCTGSHQSFSGLKTP